ncbi:DNA (cytosine-5)-methyltransferase CMT3-like [Apium graveolens]|uniref:DNA (cytosine-5)-methyltransferase CMT3-like n=1 Tax=Apium graveolens TaxID=4045 RepID=UPI003D7BA295
MAGKRNASKAGSSDKVDLKAGGKRAKVKAIEEEYFVLNVSDAEEAEQVLAEAVDLVVARKPKRNKNTGEDSVFIGDPIEIDLAKKLWPHRYLNQTKGAATTTKGATSGSMDEKCQARRHYKKAKVDGHMDFSLGDDAYVMAADGEENYICRIVEMFEGEDGVPYITAQWFYKAKDTVIKDCNFLIDSKRVFLSTIKDDNHLDCLLKKIKIVQVPLNADVESRNAIVSNCDYYYDMMYYVPFSTFMNPEHDGTEVENGSYFNIFSESNDIQQDVGNKKLKELDGSKVVLDDIQLEEGSKKPKEQVENRSKSTISSESDDIQQDVGSKKPVEMKLLDLFSGCGAMSTGLCLGATMSGVTLVTKWAVDLNQYACQSLKYNHPETEVRNEKADEFLELLKHWKRLCDLFLLIGDKSHHKQISPPEMKDSVEDNEEKEVDNEEKEVDNEEIFEVEKILSICYGIPDGQKEAGLYFKIRWKGYGEDDDTWEPEEGLCGAKDKLQEFVTDGFNSKILPLPGDADVVCGGPPCQGISGFNRFRNSENPLNDPKNEQLLVYMNIVEHLKPKYVLMENVVDIVKFAKGFLGRYALARLVGMNYQARLGMMVAGAYGLPQFRMRVFLWGAYHTMKLPRYPLPTHNVVVRGHSPLEWESNAVTYDEGSAPELNDKLYLGDAISDLPGVENNESRDEMPYGIEPETEFQKFIKLSKEVMLGSTMAESNSILYDHRPLKLNNDDYERVCQIPVRKGANFRDLKGVRVRADNKVEWDPNVERQLLKSGKPLVPEYAMSFMRGTSTKPFGRLWWDETVPTVVTRAEPHNQIIIHPTQHRVLTIRENARLQGFPDYYKLFGPIKERYIQVGNAVAVPVARVLGYSLGLSVKGCDCREVEHLLTLPSGFPNI